MKQNPKSKVGPTNTPLLSWDLENLLQRVSRGSVGTSIKYRHRYQGIPTGRGCAGPWVQSLTPEEKYELQIGGAGLQNENDFLVHKYSCENLVSMLRYPVSLPRAIMVAESN